ncbi:MAG: hypothetical protein WCG01_04920 [bacterium]
MNLDFVKSKKFKTVIIVFGGILLGSLVFSAGVSVGFHKARFAGQWNGNYERNFGRRDDARGNCNFDRRSRQPFNNNKEGGFGENFLPPMPGRPNEMMNSHGVSGQIFSLATTSFVVKDLDGLEKVVNFSSSTPVMSGFVSTSTTALKNDALVMVIGSPNNNGQIDSKLIRIFEK